MTAATLTHPGVDLGTDGRPTAESGRRRGDRRPEVARTCVHLVALERVVYPVASSVLADGADRVRELRRLGRELAVALHRLDRHLTGDVLTSRVPAQRLHTTVHAAAAEHARHERDLLAALARALPGDEIVELTRRYHRAVMAAPTRPHPYLPARGIAGAIAAAVAARVDTVRDVLDNRSSQRERIRSAAADALRDLDTVGATGAPALLASVPADRQVTR